MTPADLIDHARRARETAVAVARLFMPTGVLLAWRLLERWRERGR